MKQKQKQKQSTHRSLKTLAARVQAETLRLPNQNRLEIHFAATLFGFARLEDWREKKNKGYWTCRTPYPCSKCVCNIVNRGFCITELIPFCKEKRRNGVPHCAVEVVHLRGFPVPSPFHNKSCRADNSSRNINSWEQWLLKLRIKVLYIKFP